jgi:copper resistance protein D
MLIALLIIVRAAHIAASILIAGTFTFEVIAIGFVRRPTSAGLGSVERNLIRLAVWTLVAAFVSALLWFWLEVVAMTGLSFVDAFSARAWQTVLLKTVFGHVWQLRLGVIVIALALAVSELTGNETPRRAVVLVLWPLSVVLLVSLAWISHAAAARIQPIALIGDALHLCAAGAWIGGLIPLAIFFAGARASQSSAESSLSVIRRFSTLSLCCVSVLIASGACNSWFLVGSIRALFTTAYGWLLLFKLALFGILLSFGACNRQAINRRASTGQTSSDFLRHLRRNVICETCLGAAVVVIVACLGMTPPAQNP